MLLFIKIFSIVILLIIFLRLKFNLSLSIFLVTIYSVFLFQLNIKQAVLAGGQALIEEKTVQLFVIIIMVLYIGAIQKSRQMFDRMINALNGVIKDKRVVAMVAPSIIGFLPMPGGALFSAPLVDVSLKKMNLKPEFSTFLNFWFRHPWEFIWPVYAGLLIFQTMSGISLKKIILFQSPFTLLHIITGLVVTFIYFKKHNIRRIFPENNNSALKIVKEFFAGVWPILLVIILFFILSIPLYLSLILVALILTLVAGLNFNEVISFLFSKSILRTMVLIAMVMIFKKIISLPDDFETLKTMEISTGMIVLFSFMISFSMGFLTGVNNAYIAIAYPILLPLIQNMPNFFYLSLYIYVIGFAGILYSPLHLCLVLTNEYFKSSLFRVYKYLTFPVLSLVATSTILVLIL